MNLLAELSKENLDMSKGEITSLTNPIHDEKGRYVLFDKSNGYRKAAYTKRVFEVKETGENHESILNKYTEDIDGTYRLEALDDASKPYIDDYAKTIDGDVDLDEPDTTLGLISMKESYVVRVVWENDQAFSTRNPIERPHLHPTSLKPRFARWMINLANPDKEILDPFCGSGGILLEACEIGVVGKGGDIRSDMITYARENLESYGYDTFRLEQKDAFDYDEQVECVVTDLPYGKNSRTQETVDIILEKVLQQFSEITSEIVICFPSTTSYDTGDWHVVESYEQYVSKSLSRKILHLTC